MIKIKPNSFAFEATQTIKTTMPAPSFILAKFAKIAGVDNLIINKKMK